MKCRHCSAALKHEFLDLGKAPPSNAYRSLSERFLPETFYPLRVMVCDRCWLVQTEDYAGRSELFTNDYAYFSSFSETWLAHSEKFVREVISRFDLGSNSTVAEVAANDGYLLQYVAKAGLACYGIEPTESTALAARSKGIEIIEDFFGVNLAKRLFSEKKNADLIVANNVLAHVPDINDFTAGFRHLLKENGVATFEFPHLLSMISDSQFDTVYHEHYSYLSLTAVNNIFEANGLNIFDVQELNTHGGSLRVFAQRKDTGKHGKSSSVYKLFQAEAAAGVTSLEFYSQFQERAQLVKDEFLTYLIDSKRKGHKVAAYGAAAKGNTLLNYSGVRKDLLPFVVDRNPAKVGRYLPGSLIPICDEIELGIQKPDRILILPWNLREEIVSQLKYTKEWGAVFFVAVPRLVEIK